MRAQGLNTLFASACGAHAADQLALAALPLTASLVLGAGAGTVGILVAAQAAAWLVVSLPAGLLIDRVSRKRALVGCQMLAAVALFVAALAASAGFAPLLGLGAFVAATGIVVFVLTATSLMPALVEAKDLPAANARIELARAVVTLAAPVAVGWLATRGSPVAGYGLAGLAAVFSALMGLRLQVPAAPAAPRLPFRTALADGMRYVVEQPLLRNIGLCAIFWNSAFFALLAVFVPYALEVVRLTPAEIGLAQGALGAGSILGALSAAAVLRRFAPRIVLVAGPALSVLAIGFLLAAPSGHGLMLAAAGFALIGFGPMQWSICQQSLRQLVTPRELLGRVNATIQIAIYGIRPLGALAGGAVAAGFGPAAALWLVAGLFLASVLVPLLSSLGRLAAMPEPVSAR